MCLKRGDQIRLKNSYSGNAVIYSSNLSKPKKLKELPSHTIYTIQAFDNRINGVLLCSKEHYTKGHSWVPYDTIIPHLDIKPLTLKDLT